MQWSGQDGRLAGVPQMLPCGLCLLGFGMAGLVAATVSSESSSLPNVSDEQRIHLGNV